MMRTLLNPSDWLGQHQVLCLALLVMCMLIGASI
jgi:hypothetical protein